MNVEIRWRFVGSSTSPNQTMLGRSRPASPRAWHSSHGGGSPRYSRSSWNVSRRHREQRVSKRLPWISTDPHGAGAAVQPVHVLGHEEEAVAHPRLGRGEGVVARVRAHGQIALRRLSE